MKVNLDLKDMIISINKNSIIGKKNSNSVNFCSKICNINEKNNGIIYKCEIMCIETPNYDNFKFISTDLENVYSGTIVKNRLKFNKSKYLVLSKDLKENEGKEG